MRIFLCLTLLVSVAWTANAQEWATTKNKFIENLAHYRSTLLVSDTAQIRKLKNVLFKWSEIAPEKEELDDFVMNVSYAINSRKVGFSTLNKVLKKRLSDSELAQNFRQEDYDVIKNHSELLDLITDGILSDKYPFAISLNKKIQQELEFYNLQNDDRIGEVGAGTGTFSILICLTGVQMKLQVNEIKYWLAAYISLKYSRFRKVYKDISVGVREGSKSSPKFDHPMDKIIIRNAFHHFKKKDKMLSSIKKSLVPEGELYINEHLTDKEGNENFCRLLMSEPEILQNLTNNGFRLVDELIFERNKVYKFVKE